MVVRVRAETILAGASIRSRCDIHVRYISRAVICIPRAINAWRALQSRPCDRQWRLVGEAKGLVCWSIAG